MNHAPSSHTDRDKEWVNNQSAESYTIELADGDQAAEVAKTLYKAPKKERMAEIKYQRAGKTYYKGLYGTYPNYEAAQEALKSLPEDMKQKAGVKPWSSIQRSVND
jgi:septal ring-binding cell division protein DamX